MGKRQIPQAALTVARDAAKRVRALEASAMTALNGSNDVAAHRSAMTEKCSVLAGLPAAARQALSGTETADVPFFLDGLRDFAHRAESALSLQSIFFMSALLYPEDYQEGDSNDLERFLAQFESV